jgi:ribosome-binding factor A
MDKAIWQIHHPPPGFSPASVSFVRHPWYFVLFKPYLCGMDSTRQQKYNRLFQKEIGELFQKEGYNFFGKAFVTVTSVRVSPDLGIAKIYLSIFGVPDPNAVIAQIDKKNKEIRKHFGAQIRHQARIVPELKFFLDDSLNYVEKIEKLLNDSKPEGRKDEESD